MAAQLVAAQLVAAQLVAAQLVAAVRTIGSCQRLAPDTL